MAELRLTWNLRDANVLGWSPHPLLPRGRRQITAQSFHVCKLSFVNFFIPYAEDADTFGLFVFNKKTFPFTLLSSNLEFSSSILLQPTPRLSDSFTPLLKSQGLDHSLFSDPCIYKSTSVQCQSSHFPPSTPLSWELPGERPCLIHSCFSRD